MGFIRYEGQMWKFGLTDVEKNRKVTNDNDETSSVLTQM